jgi:hypothetical protein
MRSGPSERAQGYTAPYVLGADEDAAFRFLERAPRRGGVLSRYYLGMAVPAFTGRSTWTGHFTWTPGFEERLRTADDLFSGRLGVTEPRKLVRSARPAYLLAGCGQRTDLTALLKPLVARTHRFGCAPVYEVKAAQA